MNKLTLALVGIVFIALIFFYKGQFVNKEKSGGVTTESTLNLATHPVYSAYKFSEKENIINIGDQPLYLPNSLISEAMKHDLLLKEALSQHDLEIRFYSFLKGNDVNYFIKRGALQAGISGDMPTISGFNFRRVRMVSTEYGEPSYLLQC